METIVMKLLKKMKYALDTYVIKGVTHNIPLLREVFSNPRFAAGRLSTKFLPEEYPEGFRGKKLEGEVLEQFLATAGMVHVNIQRNKASWVDANVIGTNFSNKQDIVISVIGKSYPITLESNASGNQVNVTYNGKKIALKTEWPLYSHLIHLNIDGKQQLFQYLDPLPEGFVLQLYGSKFDVTVRTPEQQNAAKYMKEKPKLDHAKFTLSPMPGNVVSVAVQAGDVVAEGQELAIIEAMKMQNVLHAEKVGKVKAVHVKPGQSVEGQQILIEFEDEAKEEKKK
jgi:propionyl-CoA carboxylase alpha chain